MELGEAGERYVDRLAALAPPTTPDGARLALVAPGAEAIGEALRARGFAVAALDSAAGAVPPHAARDGGWDAVVLAGCLDGASPLVPLLASLRSLLAERGQLLIAPAFEPAGDASAVDPRQLTVALSECGFVILRQADPVWTARRDPFRVREYRAGDETQILPIFEGSFFVRRSLERWSWEYRDNPYGNLNVSEAFAEDGQLVAHYAGFPVRFRRAGDPLPLVALQIGDTMTLPGVRHVGRGPTSLLGRTVRHFYARFCAGRVAFNYGFNTGNIQRFSMAFVGARRLEDLPFHLLELPAPRLQPRPGLLARLADGLRGWRCQTVDRFDARWDAFFSRVAPAYGMLVERDARYLDWRFRRQPEGEYRTYACLRRQRLAGWGVFRRRGEVLLWIDALFDPGCPEAVSRLLAHVLAQPEHRGVTRVEAWVTARPAWWRPLLLELGFAARPEPNGLGLVFVPFEVDPEADFRAQLYYTMGDSDLF